MSNRLNMENLSPRLTDVSDAIPREESADGMFKKIVEFSNDAVVVVQEGKTVYRNPACERLIGYTVDETKECSFLERIVPEYRSMVARYNENRMNGEEAPTNYEVEILTRDGERVPLEIKVSVIVYRGKPAAVAYMRDISKRRRTEELYGKSCRKYKKLYTLMRLMADNVPDLIWAKDIQDRFLFANRAICDKLLKSDSTDEPLGKNDLYFACRERGRGHNHTFGEICVDSDAVVKASGRPGRFLEDGLVRGKYLVLDVHKAPFYNEKGEMIGTVGCGRDVTVEKEKDEALRQSEERFRKFLEDVSEISIQGYDEERNVTFWNHASEKLYGYSEAEAVGMKLEDLIIPAHMREAVVEKHRCWLDRGEKIPPGELVLVDKYGCDVTVFSSHVMLETSLGREMFCIDLDMNPISLMEKEKEALQSQLRQSQKMEAVGTLAGGIAHDFNNILQAIGGYAEIMFVNRTENDPDYKNLSAVRKATARAGELVRQLLLFSRKAEISKRPIQINHEIKQARSLLEKTIPKMIDIKVDLAGDLWNVNVDPVQIEQMILNLGSNAADAMPEGGVITVETTNRSLDGEYVRTHVGAQTGDHVLLSISDTGIGMDRNIMDKIFEPFFTTKDSGKGTGLGLASVYGIVKSHDGYITCASEPGRGTKFEIYLPALKVPSRDPAEKPLKLKKGTETILVVDDEAPVLELTSMALSGVGYTVITAFDGREAVEIYERKQDEIDLVILDVSMPKMGGRECLKTLLELNPQVKVFIASGYSSSAHINDSIALGAMGYIGKPYKFRELFKEIRRILDGEV